MTELRKCPFCGGEATVSEIQDTWQNDTGHWYILCDECSCCLGGYGEFTTEEEAIEAWNKRVPQTWTSKAFERIGEVNKTIEVEE